MAPNKPCAPPSILSAPVLGSIVCALLSCTTFLYLNHDRDNKEWVDGTLGRSGTGYWPPPSADFDWCEPNYLYTPYIAEVWNTITSLLFCVGPVLLWSSAATLSVRLNLLLVVGIGLGSAAFHATLQYRDQLLDELPMILYIANTVALLAGRGASCPRALWAGGLVLSVTLLATEREDTSHKIGRLVMVLSFSGCFIWLAFNIAPRCVQLDQRRTDYMYTRGYQKGALAVLVAIVAWALDNLACRDLHHLPLGLPYPQLHATVWHTMMAYVCRCLCRLVVGTQQMHAAAKKGESSEPL